MVMAVFSKEEAWLSSFALAGGCARKSTPFDPVEVGVLDGHDLVVGEELLGEVVDELSVDEHVDPVVDDLLALGEHAFLHRGDGRGECECCRECRALSCVCIVLYCIVLYCIVLYCIVLCVACCVL